MAKKAYVQVISSYRSPITFSCKGDGQKAKDLTIPGKIRVNQTESKNAVTYITKEQCEELARPVGDKPSSFKVLIDEAGKGKDGYYVNGASFEEMPDDFQKLFDPAKYKKLIQAKQKLAAEEVEK